MTAIRTGLALVEVLQDGEVIASGTVQVATVAPGIFTATASGEGVPAALFLRFRSGDQTAQGFTFDPGQPLGARQPILLDFGGEDETLFVAIFGTGMRGGSVITATLDGEAVRFRRSSRLMISSVSIRRTSDRFRADSSVEVRSSYGSSSMAWRRTLCCCCSNRQLRLVRSAHGQISHSSQGDAYGDARTMQWAS
jgi:hypothetical protein